MFDSDIRCIKLPFLSLSPSPRVRVNGECRKDGTAAIYSDRTAIPCRPLDVRMAGFAEVKSLCISLVVQFEVFSIRLRLGWRDMTRCSTMI